MDLMHALGFPFDDEDWPVKTLIGTFVMLFAFLPFVPLGYQAYVAREVLRGQRRPLPGASDIGAAISDGLMVFIAWLLYNLPLIILGCVLVFGGSVLGGSDLGALLFLALALCLGGFMLIQLIISTVFFGMGMIRFAETGNFTAFLHLGDLWYSVREHTMLLLELALYMIGLGIAGGVLMSAFSVTCIGAPLIAFFWQVMTGHLIGQAARQVAEKDKRSSAARGSWA